MKNTHETAINYYYNNKNTVSAKSKLRYAINKWVDANAAYADGLTADEIAQLRKQIIKRMFEDNCAKFKTAEELKGRATELLQQAKGKGPKVLHVDMTTETEPGKKKMKRSRHEKRLAYYQSKRADFVAYSKAYTAAQKWVNDNMSDVSPEEKKKSIREITKTLIPQFYTEDIRPYNPHKNQRKRRPEKVTEPVKDLVEGIVGDEELVSTTTTTSIDSPLTNITVAGDVKIDPIINVSLSPDTGLNVRPNKYAPLEVVVAFKDPFFVTFIMSIILTCAILIAMFVK